jgi:hypothetical protein
VNSDCGTFRRRLERALEGARTAEELSNLSWHEHLLGCADCRALLEAEEALEMLLASLPEPRLPAQLARRVLARLRSGEEARLDRLLELDLGARAPGDLAQRVLAGLEHERARPAANLDALLECEREVDLPEGLSRRVLAHLAEERALARRRKPVRARLALLAGLLLLALWAFWPKRERAGHELGSPTAGIDPRMLEHFDVLEHWELLQRNDLDTLLSTLPRADQALLEMGSEEGVLGG